MKAVHEVEEKNSHLPEKRAAKVMKAATHQKHLANNDRRDGNEIEWDDPLEELITLLKKMTFIVLKFSLGAWILKIGLEQKMK